MMSPCYCVPTPYSIQNRDIDPYDIFERIIPDTDKYAEQKRLALWDRFHDTGIGNDNEPYWIRCMKARADEVSGRYDIKMRAFVEYKTRLEAAESVDLSDGKIVSNSVNRTYDPPETPSGVKLAENFLAEQNRTDYEQQSFGGLEPETVRQYADAVDNPFERWAAEFDRLFYWGL